MSGSQVSWEITYKPPLDWPYFLDHWRGRTTEGVEIEGKVGVIKITPNPRLPKLEISVDQSLQEHREIIDLRVRRMFDLDIDLEMVQTKLGTDPHLGPMLVANPGMRIPGAWSPFEALVRTIVGQQVTVRAATTIMGRIVSRLGVAINSNHGPIMLFPTPLVIADAALNGIGMPGKRVQTLQNLARAVHEKRLQFPETKGDISELRAALLKMPGIGPWTVEYFALRALGDADAWPESDLVVRREVERLHPELTAKERQQMDRWRPFRGYAAVHLWRHASQRKSEAEV